MKIAQLVASMSPGDAVSNSCLFIDKLVKNHGHSSQIYAENIHPVLSSRVLPMNKIFKTRYDRVIFHMSIGSGVPPILQQLKAKYKTHVIMIYHNITPSHYFLGINNHVKELTELGRQQLQELVPTIDLPLAVSQFNAEELKRVGYQNVAVLPFPVERERIHLSTQNVNRDQDVFLTVGRIAPNKKHEDTIKIFWNLKNEFFPDARLVIVGSDSGMEIYKQNLERLVDKLGLNENVIFTGHVTDQELIRIYNQAAAFLICSEHEGFCVPLVEAMGYQIPIFAREMGAIPETLGGAGVTFHLESYYLIAKLIKTILENKEIVDQIIELQNERLKQLMNQQIELSYLELLTGSVKHLV